MGHRAGHGGVYGRLQQQLDRTPTGAPDSAAFQQLLRLLFAPEEAELACRLPIRPTPLSSLSRRLRIPVVELDARLSDMGHRGLILDVEAGGQRFACLAPVVIGFFEFTFMRVRRDLPMREVARLFEEYKAPDGPFLRSMFQGETQLGRSVVHEGALPEDEHTEVLDWERASHLVQTATAAAVSLCACRHEARHRGRACKTPLRSCLSLNDGARVVARDGLGEPLTTVEAMRLLEDAREAGLAQTADNVQSGVSFICNCCRCCCGFFAAYRHLDTCRAIVTSNWLATVDAGRCKGCGRCEQACPVNAITMVPAGSGRTAVCDESVCLGCGVCYSACRAGALSLRRRDRLVIPPETAIERTITMALERGKLAQLFFDDPTRLSQRALARIVGALERSSPARAAMAIAPLRSAFLNAVAARARSAAARMAGPA